MDLTIEFDDQLPTHWVVIRAADAQTLTISCSAKVEASALRALLPEIALEITRAIEAGSQS